MERMRGGNVFRDELFPWLLFVTFVVGMFVLAGYVRMGADDFFYACFWDNGVSGFADMTRTHFFESSGRVFVHLFCSSVLWLGMSAYQVTVTFLVATLAILVALVVAENGAGSMRGSLMPFAWSVALFCAGFACLGLGVMREAVLWNAGLFNYLFPVWLQLLYVYLLMRDLRKGDLRKGDLRKGDLRKRDLRKQRASRILWLLAFFCGATVEQTGIFVIFTTVALLATDSVRTRQRPGPWQLLCLPAGTLGYATLFLSPGVTERLDKNGAFTALPVTRKIMANLPVVARMVVGEGGIGLLLSLALVLGWIVLIPRLKPVLERLASAVGLLGAVLLLWMTSSLVLISDRVVIATSVAAFLSLLYLCVRLWISGEATGACMLSFGLLSAAVMLVSPVLGMRMLFPASVFFLVAMCRFVVRMMWTENTAGSHRVRQWLPLLSCACLLLVAVPNQMGFHTGYARNEPVLQANIDKTLQAAASGTPALVLEAVPDERYGYENIPVHYNFTEWYVRYYHLPEDIGISVADPSKRPLQVQGKPLAGGVIFRDGTAYVPLRSIFESLGYTVSWKQSNAVAESGDVAFLFKAASSVVRIQQPAGSRSLRLEAPVRNIHTQLYVPLDFVVKTLGGNLELRRDAYVLTF